MLLVSLKPPFFSIPPGEFFFNSACFNIRGGVLHGSFQFPLCGPCKSFQCTFFGTGAEAGANKRVGPSDLNKPPPDSLQPPLQGISPSTREERKVRGLRVPCVKRQVNSLFSPRYLICRGTRLTLDFSDLMTLMTRPPSIWTGFFHFLCCRNGRTQ